MLNTFTGIEPDIMEGGHTVDPCRVLRVPHSISLSLFIYINIYS